LRFILNLEVVFIEVKENLTMRPTRNTLRILSLIRHHHRANIMGIVGARGRTIQIDLDW
jgi:hypothetical protein